MWDGTISTQAVGTLAQVLPALLIAGLLGPVLAQKDMPRGDRVIYLVWVVPAVVAEGVLLLHVAMDLEMSGWWLWLMATAFLLAALALLRAPLTWAARTPTENRDRLRAVADKARLNTEEAEREAARAETTASEPKTMDQGGRPASSYLWITPAVISRIRLRCQPWMRAHQHLVTSSVS